MQIVRALWNSYEGFKNEIPLTPLYDEVVFVWGIENEKYLKNLGYKTILVSQNNAVYNDTTIHFLHKIECFKKAGEQYNEFLFLDWDIKQIKPLDEIFFSLVRKKNISAPLYAYPKQYVEYYSSTNEFYTWEKQCAINLKKYSWQYEDMFILPNASFVYVSNNEIIKEMESIIYNNNLNTLIEEFLLFNLVNCTLDEYICNHEPLVLYGRPYNHSFVFKNKIFEVFKQTQSIISQKIKKDIYFEHD